MTDKNFKTFTLRGFVTEYMENEEEQFLQSEKPLQVYPLSLASKFLKPPVPLFRARYNFLLLFAKGGGRQQVNNDLFDLYPNDILFIREGHLNAIQAIHPDTEGYFLYIDNTLLPTVIQDQVLLHRLTFHPRQCVSPADMAWLCKCCELVLPAQGNDRHSKDISTSILRAIMHKLADATQTSLAVPDRQTELTMRFKELLYQSFHTNREVGFYADALAVSENYLNRCVKNVTGKPPKVHVHEMVIVHSKILLQNQSRDIAEIAFDLNFSDPSHFGRLFKQLTAQTPSEYRAGLLQDLSG